jgi:ATP adenylyltransferase
MPSPQLRCNATTTQSSQLWKDIVETYDKARAAQASTITDTSTDVHLDNSVPFILKIAAQLRDKPKGPPPPNSNDSTSPKPKKEWKNPFLPPEKDLFVCHLSETHSLVLNKFNILPHHALVITREFIPQEDPLTAADFTATWQVMEAMPSGGLAYFNRGPVSGASQPHKHMQIIPLPLNPLSPIVETSENRQNVQDPPFWPAINEATAGKPTGSAGATSVSSFPFANFVARIGREISGEEIAETHATLVDLAFKAAINKSVASASDFSKFSYNTIATRDFLMVVPRNKEGSGPVSCNAMAFAGSFFVRGVDELEYIKEQGPFKILKDVGIATS